MKAAQRIDWIYEVFKGGTVARCHTIDTVKPYNNAEHTYYAVMIANEICDDINGHNATPFINDYSVIHYLLIHDLHECESGDLPAPFKKKYPAIGQQLKEHAVAWRGKNLPSRYKGVSITGKELAIAKMADYLELMRYCIKEYNMGSNNTLEMFSRAKQYIKELNEEVKSRFVMELIMKLTGELV